MGNVFFLSNEFSVVNKSAGYSLYSAALIYSLGLDAAASILPPGFNLGDGEFGAERKQFSI